MKIESCGLIASHNVALYVLNRQFRRAMSSRIIVLSAHNCLKVCAITELTDRLMGYLCETSGHKMVREARAPEADCSIMR